MSNNDRKRLEADAERQREKQREDRERLEANAERQREKQKEDRERLEADAERQREKQREDRERLEANAERQREKQREDRERLEANAERLEADAERQREDTRRLQVDAEKRRKLAAKLRADNRHFKAFMAEVRGQLESITRAFGQLGVKGASIANSQSPLTLNDFGQEISQAFGAKAWAEAHMDDVREKVAGKSAYDIQQFCFDYVTENILTKDELQRAKSITFENGTILLNVLRVLAFELRDLLLTEGEVEVDALVAPAQPLHT